MSIHTQTLLHDVASDPYERRVQIHYDLANALEFLANTVSSKDFRDEPERVREVHDHLREDVRELGTELDVLERGIPESELCDAGPLDPIQSVAKESVRLARAYMHAGMKDEAREVARRAAKYRRHAEYGLPTDSLFIAADALCTELELAVIEAGDEDAAGKLAELRDKHRFHKDDDLRLWLERHRELLAGFAEVARSSSAAGRFAQLAERLAQAFADASEPKRISFTAQESAELRELCRPAAVELVQGPAGRRRGSLRQSGPVCSCPGEPGARGRRHPDLHPGLQRGGVRRRRRAGGARRAAQCRRAGRR